MGIAASCLGLRAPAEPEVVSKPEVKTGASTPDVANKPNVLDQSAQRSLEANKPPETPAPYPKLTTVQEYARSDQPGDGRAVKQLTAQNRTEARTQQSLQNLRAFMATQPPLFPHKRPSASFWVIEETISSPISSPERKN